MSSILFDKERMEGRRIKALIAGAVLAVPASVAIGLNAGEGSVDFMFIAYPFVLAGLTLALVLLDLAVVIPLTSAIEKRKEGEGVVVLSDDALWEMRLACYKAHKAVFAECPAVSGEITPALRRSDFDPDFALFCLERAREEMQDRGADTSAIDETITKIYDIAAEEGATL